MLGKRPGEISLMDVINCTESTMAISRCLEKDGYCSRNYSDCCKVHKVLLDLQNTYNNSLENVKISDIIQPGKDEYFGRFYVVIKLNLKDQTYECIYSHVHEVYDKVSASASYGEFVKKYTEQYVHEQDRQKLQEFLASEKLTEHLVDGCMEEDMSYRRICDNEADSYIWMEAKRYVDETENTAILTFHNAKVIPDTIVNMEQELQKNYPEYGITEEEIENVSHLAPIHDIGKIRVPIEILIINGECGAFSMKLLQCFLAAAMQKEWVQKVEMDTEA